MFRIPKKRESTLADLSAHILTLEKENLHIILVEDERTAVQLKESLQHLQSMGYALPPTIITASKFVKSIQIEPFSNKIDA